MVETKNNTPEGIGERRHTDEAESVEDQANIYRDEVAKSWLDGSFGVGEKENVTSSSLPGAEQHDSGFPSSSVLGKSKGVALEWMVGGDEDGLEAQQTYLENLLNEGGFDLSSLLKAAQLPENDDNS